MPGREKRANTEVLFLHSIGLDHRIWTDVLAPGERTLDFPGHGSEPPTKTLSMAGLVEYVLGHLSEPVTLVGLSLGGMVAQQITLRAPDAVASLVVAAAPSATRRDVIAERVRTTRDSGMAGVLEATLMRWFTPGALAIPGHAGVEYARKRLLADDPEVIARYWETLGEHDVTSELASIRVPATFIAGGRDVTMEPETMERMARSVPGAVFEIIDGPHILPLEKPGEFRAALDRHLARCA